MAKSKIKSSKKNKWLIIAGLVLLATLAYIGIDQYRDYQDREKFRRLEAAVESIDYQLVNEIGLEPKESSKYCHYAQAKWENPALTCVLANHYDYGDVERNKLLGVFIDKELSFVTEVIRDDSYNDNHEIVFTVNNYGDTCSIFIVSDGAELRCADPALSEHYPLSSRE